MYTIARSTRRFSWTGLIVVPLVVAACGGDNADAHPVTTGNTSTPAPTAGTPTATVVPAANVTVSPPVVARPVPTAPVTYQVADDVFNARQYPEAVEAFERYVTDKPNDAFGYYMLGLSAWKAGQFNRAEDAFDESIDRNPAFAKSYFNSARVLLDLQRAPEALERVEKGLAIDSTSADGWRLKARAQAASGDFNDAVTTYHQLLVRNGEDLWGLNDLGMLLLDSGDYQGALGPLARVVQLKPTAPLFQNNYGIALERAGDPVAAIHAYEAAVRDDSTFTRAVKNLDRLRAGVTDTTTGDEVSLQDLAEQFREKVKAWKDSTVVQPDTTK